MKEKIIHILLVGTFASVFYVNIFDNFFVWNDWTLIIENSLIKDWRNLPEIFTSAFWKPLLGEPFQVYRPLVLVSFMLDLSLWGLNPWGYHLTNILLHVLNSILTYILMGLYVSPTTAFIGSVLFASHPIHIGAVTYISGREELLASFFLLSGIISFLLSDRLQSRLLYPASLMLLCLALFAKETAVIFPLLFVIADWMLPAASRNGRPALRLGRHVAPVILAGLYLVWRALFVGRTNGLYEAGLVDLFHSVLLMFKASFLYLSLLAPWNLHFHEWVEIGIPFRDPQLWLGFLLLLGAVWRVRHAWRSGNQAVAFSVLWLLVYLLPLLYQASVVEGFFESWYYLPSLGVFLLAGLGMSRIQFAQAHIVWITFLIAVLLGVLTSYGNREWKNDMQIALHVSEASPGDPVALRLLGRANFRRGRVEEAEKAFQKGVDLSERDPRLHELLGRLYSFLDRDTDALASYHRMRDLAPRDPYSYWRIGRFYFEKRNLLEAEKHFAEAARLFPYSSEIHNDLAQVYFRQGKLEKARGELEAALRISPYSSTLRENLDSLLKRARPA